MLKKRKQNKCLAILAHLALFQTRFVLEQNDKLPDQGCTKTLVPVQTNMLTNLMNQYHLV